MDAGGEVGDGRLQPMRPLLRGETYANRCKLTIQYQHLAHTFGHSHHQRENIVSDPSFDQSLWNSGRQYDLRRLPHLDGHHVQNISQGEWANLKSFLLTAQVQDLFSSNTCPCFDVWVLLSPPTPSFSGANEAFWHCQCDNHTHWDPLYHSPALCFWIRRKVICELTLWNLLLPRLSHDFHRQFWVWPAILHCCRDCLLRHLYASWRLHIPQASFEMSKC